ncbi:M48 family metallopeptidase [Anaerosporobacter faecicola]|uniref:M48 family metallopeptidase n=1 Tax=Anaerosporobacter faecicola TaxID=2718714 RepID=UPI00143AD44F|nr:SprT family zinc-dependent metalloprotease [Anaerosporobacter faecicola]
MKKAEDEKQLLGIRESKLIYSNLEISYEMMRSRRKSIAIAIAVGGKVTIKIPTNAREQEVLHFLQERSSWIYDSYKEQIQREKRGIHIEDGGKIPFLSEEVTVRILPNLNKVDAKIRYIEEQKQLIIETPKLWPAFLRECVESWYKKNAKSIIPFRVEQVAKVMQLTYGRITIRSQKSRWGSCSSEGNLNFNWHLIMMPPAILDYVIIHELAHRVEMNHSKQFWAIVEQACPDYKQRRLWLKEHGSSYEFLDT